MFLPPWGRWGTGQPDAGLGDAGEVLVELHEIQHVALDLASKTHEALLLRVDREAGSAFFVERAQPLECAWPSTPQLDTDSLHHLEQRIRVLHRAEVVRRLAQQGATHAPSSSSSAAAAAAASAWRS